MILSICIPTYNRAKNLKYCLDSIVESSNLLDFLEVEICISDNCSDDETPTIIKDYSKILKIKYMRLSSNNGRVRNYINVVKMAVGEFIWLLGDDDLLLKGSIEHVYELLVSKPNIDFFYINSSHLSSDKLLDDSLLRRIKNRENLLERFSKYKYTGELPFMELIDYEKSFDFLGGMFLAVFRKKLWDQNISNLDLIKACDMNEFSSLDNTFPHLKIFAAAFFKSKAFFESIPQSITVTGVREWAPLYPVVRSIRTQELLEEYRYYGLSFQKYYSCRNKSLEFFAPDLLRILICRKKYPYLNINYIKIILKNLIYPNMYLSIINSLMRLYFKIYKYINI